MKRTIGRVSEARSQNRRVARRARWPLGVALLVGVTSCFGDIVIEREKPATDELDPTDVNALEPSCELGLVHCEGQWLEICDDRVTPGQPEWSRVKDCLSPTLCVEDPGNCLSPECRAGAPRCSGATPETCNGTLDGYDAAGECVNAAHCSPDETKCSAEGKGTPCCLDVPCEAGELRCNGNEMQRCRDDQTDLDVIVGCETFELCEASRSECDADPESCECRPPVCDAGATRCTGTTLERCNLGRTGWEPVQECVTRELCEQSRSRVPLACAPEVCLPNEFNCNEASLELCNVGQTAFEPQMVCTGGPGFCNEGLGICSQCEVGDTRCDGAQIQTCRVDRSGFDPVAGANSLCATPQLCGRNASGAAVCAAPACAVEAFNCVGNQLQRCNEGRTAFEPFGPACNRADLCSGARKRCDFCVPNRRECTFDRVSSRTCDADGDAFGPLTNCPLGCIPETGECRTCTVGNYSCGGGQLARCNDGFSFTPLNRAADCSGANRITCNGATVQTSPCGTLGCNTTRNACNECNVAVPTSCAAGLLCSTLGQCRCTPNAFGCNDDALLRCNNGGTATAAGPRCNGGTDNNVLRSCNDGVLTENGCETGAFCAAAVGSVCPVCTPGQLSCATGVLSSCSNSGLGFEAASKCAGLTLRACNGTQLLQEPCGSAALCLASVGNICAECLETEDRSCDAEGFEISCIRGERTTNPCLGTLECVDVVGCTEPVVDPPAAP